MDFIALAKSAQAMQERMKQMKARLGTLEATGTAGGGLVSVVMTADGRVRDVAVDVSLLDPGERVTVQDLLIAAFNEAQRKAKLAASAEAQQLFGGMPIPEELGTFLNLS